MKNTLKTGGIYRIASRNLSFGVWNGTGFIGIREKFGCTYLFTEYPWEDGPPYGTVRLSPRAHVADLLPSVPLAEYTGAVCVSCRHQMSEEPLVSREREHHCGCDCDQVRSMLVMNQDLYNVLLAFIPDEEKTAWERSRKYFTRRGGHDDGT